MALLRVVRVDDDRIGASPVIEWLDWTGRSLPAGWRTRRLTARAGNIPALGGPRRPDTYLVTRHRKKDPDWTDTGFVLVTRLPPRPQDAAAQAWTYLGWQALARELERSLAG